MPQPDTTQYSDAWHNAEDAQERAWLDDWMRGRICTVCLEACPVKQPASAEPALTTTAGSR